MDVPAADSMDVLDWHTAVGASSWQSAVWHPPQYKSEPEVILYDSAGDSVVQVRMADARDGVHVYVMPFPDRQEPPSLHLVFRDLRRWTPLERSKMAAGLLAAVGMRALRPRLSKQKGEHATWLRTVYRRLRATVGLDPSPYLATALGKALELCERRFESAARLDAGEAWARLRADVGILLASGATEEDVVREVREIQAMQVLRE